MELVLGSGPDLIMSFDEGFFVEVVKVQLSQRDRGDCPFGEEDGLQGIQVHIFDRGPGGDKEAFSVGDIIDDAFVGVQIVKELLDFLTVDFLVFTRDAGEDGIEVRVQNGDVWLTQKAISQLFDVDRSVITKHLSNIFKEGELDENSVCAKFAQTADDGKTYNYKFYSLEAIIAVGVSH